MLIVAFIALAAGRPFYTSGVTGSQIATLCQATTDNKNVNGCTAYSLGVYDALSQQAVICGGSVVTIEQIVAVSKKAFADHPEDWSKPPSFLIGAAFKKAFPCSP